MDSTFPAGSTNRIYYTPETYPLDDIGLVLSRLSGTSWAAVAYAGTITADPTNAARILAGLDPRYYLDLASGECTAGLYRFAWELTDGTQVRTDTEYGICTEGESVTLLATPEDLIAFDHLDDDGLPIGWKKLARASLRVKRYARQTITAVAGDVVTKLDDPYLLPQKPVTSITSVVDADGTTLTEDTAYVVRGNRLEMSPAYGPVTVTYDHGFTVVPEELREVVCSIAVRLQDAPQGLKTGVASESAPGGDVRTWGSQAYSGIADLTPDEKRVIDSFYPRLGFSTDIL